MRLCHGWKVVNIIISWKVKTCRQGDTSVGKRWGDPLIPLTMAYCWFIGFDGFQMSFLSRFALNHRFSWVISQKAARDWPSLADNDNSQRRLTTWRRLNLDKTSRTLTYKRNPSLLWPTPTVWRNDSSALKWLIVTFGCVGEPREVEMSSHRSNFFTSWSLTHSLPQGVTASRHRAICTLH